ncbi:MAG: hypothetical protein ABMB14_14795 [Myxococcota bacterium]
MIVSLVACNLQGQPWPDDSIGPDGKAPWSHPTDLACVERGDPDQKEIDGYLFCGADEARQKVPIDDPVYAPCAGFVAPFDGPVLAVFDGVLARGYSVDLLKGREIVNDDWAGEPIVVDY